MNRLRAVLEPLFYCVVVSTALRCFLSRLAPVLVLSALVVGADASKAVAAGFTVASCQSDRLRFSHDAFDYAVESGMRIIRACNPIGAGLRGVVTASQPKVRRVDRGRVAVVTITAPAGTQMEKLRWEGTVRRRDCRYSLQIWADAPGTRMPARALKKLSANRGCPRPGLAQTAGLEVINKEITGATRIVQRVACVGAPKRKWCAGGKNNYIRTGHITVSLSDYVAPSVQIIPDTPLATGAWVSGAQPLNYTASDTTGVRGARVLLGGRERGRHSRPCAITTEEGHFATPVPCPDGPGQIEVLTGLANEGTQTLTVEAHDPAGNASYSDAVSARIDNTPPARVDVAVEGGQDWRSRNDWVAVWTNPPEVDRAPIAATHYELCAVGGTSCTRDTQTGTDVSRLPIAVPRPGEWRLSVWRRDAAGNAEEDNASVPVTLRYDPEPPQLAFQASEAGDPTRVAVEVTDRVSGVADGVIEIAASGSGLWQILGTQKEGGRLVARIDDAALPPGPYLLRARARDLAGNEASTESRADGQPMLVTLPLRSPASVDAGFERMVRRGPTRPGRRIELRRVAKVGFGERVAIAGRLATRDGRPIAGAHVQLLTSAETEPERLVETLTTDADGRFRTLTSGLSTRRLRLAYAGSPVALPSQQTLEMRVPAITSVRVSPRRVRNGRAITFSGRVRGLPVPADGKLVEVQVRFTDRWQTFRTTRTNLAGEWSSRYRFQRTRGLQRYRFRIRLPKEGGYPFETSVSHTLSVVVRGR